MMRMWRALGVGTAVAAVIGFAWANSTSDLLTISTGPTPAVADAISTDHPTASNPENTGKVLIMTVASEPLSHWQALLCEMASDCAAVSDAGPQFITEAEQQMNDSVRTADQVATQLAGSNAQWPKAPGPIHVNDIAGPSAGLALTLHLLAQRVPGDLTAGKTIAATGAINSDGTVAPVGGVQYKSTGAATADADVFFVPAAEAAQATDAGTVPVVPVKTVTDAVNWLCAHGATSKLCSAPTPRTAPAPTPAK